MKKAAFALFFFFTASSLQAATLPTAQGPTPPSGMSPAQSQQRNTAAEDLVSGRNAAITAEATTEPAEYYEPPTGQPYSVRVTLNSAGKITGTLYTDWGANDHRATYTYSSSGVLSSVSETISGCNGPACFSDTKTQRFGRDSKGRFVLSSKTETGMPTLNYTYWYDSSNPNLRHYRARTASGAEYGVGRETLDSAGRVTSQYFRQTSSDTGYSHYDYDEGIHQYPTTGRNVVTQRSFTYYTQNSRSYVRENVWYNGAATSNPPDGTKTYRNSRGIQLRERYTQNKFAPGNRSTVTERYTILQSFNV
jgi:hypothetical protein